MTLHAAKGLEFPHVFMPGVEDGTLPHFHSIGEGDDALEEERRLLYVGITSAKRRLVVTWSSSRNNHHQVLSRYLSELDGSGVSDEGGLTRPSSFF